MGSGNIETADIGKLMNFVMSRQHWVNCFLQSGGNTDPISKKSLVIEKAIGENKRICVLVALCCFLQGVIRKKRGQARIGRLARRAGV